MNKVEEEFVNYDWFVHEVIDTFYELNIGKAACFEGGVS